MWKCLVFALLPLAYAFEFHQNKYYIEQHKFEVESMDQSILNLTGEVYQFNNSVKALRVAVLLHRELPSNTKFHIKALKQTNGAYRIGIIQIDKNLKDVLEMELFDLQSLFVAKCRPPLAWPVQKEMAYRITGWNPDSTKFPPNLPESLYKVILAISIQKKKIIIMNWFAEVIYNT